MQANERTAQHTAVPEKSWAGLRRHFPVLSTCTYLDTATSGPVSLPAARAAARYYGWSSRLASTGTELWLEEAELSRRAMADLIGAPLDDIGFVANTSSAISCAALTLEGHGAVLTARGEHPSIVVPWLARGFRVDVAEPNENGELTLESYARALRPDTIAIAVSHVRYDDGRSNDLPALGALAKAAGAHLIVDATQSAGVLRMDVAWGMDVVAFGGFKWLNAGLGAAVLYIRSSLLERYGLPIAGNRSRATDDLLHVKTLEPLLQARALELGAPVIPGILALGAAWKLIERIGPAAIEERIRGLTDSLRAGLNSLGLTTTTDRPSGARTAIISVCVPRAEAVCAALRDLGVIVALRAGRIRIAVSWYNDHEDLAACLAAMAAATTS